jgi:hypothetical protein
MNNPVLWQAGIGLLTLFFFFLMYMFTKTWRWFHVTVMFFVYCASIATVVYVSMTIKTHNAWRTMVRDHRAEIAKLSKVRDMFTFGDIMKAEQDTVTINELNARWGRATLERGRVWRACTIANGPAGDGTLTMNTTGATATPGARNNIKDGMILYAFTEAPAPADLAPELLDPTSAIGFPRYFIGEFTVTAVADTTVTLRPTFNLADMGESGRELVIMVRALMASGAPWCLYETMAPDGHPFFAKNPDERPELSLDANDSPVFGVMDEEQITSYMARSGQLQTETLEQFKQRYQSIILEYVRDGKRATAEDPPENRWLKVRFTGNYSETVDSASKLGAIITSEDFFDRGRAEIEILQRGEDATFKKGDIGIFPPLDANRLIDLGVCELVEPIYVRSLRSYAQTYRELYQRSRDLEADIARVKRNTAELEHANTLAESQIAYREQEQTKLDVDLAKFVYERDEIEKYSKTLAATYTDKRNKLSFLYRANHKLAADLAKVHRVLTANIDRETAAAADAP